MKETKKDRAEVCNTIIEAMGDRGKNFFRSILISHNSGQDLRYVYAQLFIKNRQIYLKTELKKDILLTGDWTKSEYWLNGHTLYYVVAEMKRFIETGIAVDPKKTQLIGLYWGYPQSDIDEINQVAKEEGYLF